MDIIAVAESLNKIRAKKRYGKDAKMVYFGVNYDFFSKGNRKRAAKKFNLEKRFVVIQSGMLTGVKNQIESIKTVEKLKDKIPNILLILTGRDDLEYRKKLDNYVKEKRLGKWVLFAGNLPTREELADLYKASDVGLFPIGKMGGVLAPFEVLCAGTPVVVSENIETAEIIKKNNLGVVTKEYDKAILDIYNNKEKFKLEAKKASEFIQKNLSWEKFAERMIKSYKDAWKKYK
jgi:glycosyltransferase involved in cell wall biosynthesis